MKPYHQAMRVTKYALWSALVATLALAAQTVRAETLAFDFSSVPGATIKFTGTGDKIEFPTTDAEGFDFAITTTTSPALGGMRGNIEGTFQVGAITTMGLLEQASVTTTDGTFSVYDGAGSTLTASLDWKDMLVYGKLVGGMNITGLANLTNIDYSGNNVDLLSLKGGTDQTATLTFQFSAGTMKSLAQLMADGQVNSTSYSGSVSATVPEPSSCMLLLMAGLGLVGCLWRRR